MARFNVEKNRMRKEPNIDVYVEKCRKLLIKQQATRKIEFDLSDNIIIASALAEYASMLEKEIELFHIMSGHYD